MEKTTKYIHVCGKNYGLISEGERKLRTCVLDCGEYGNVWHRMSFSVRQKLGAVFWVSVYASDDELLTYKNRTMPISEVLYMNEGEEKEGFLERALIKTCENPKDILLHDVLGRYLWCRIEVSAINGVCFDSITVSTPSHSFLKYLPEFFSEDINKSFLDKYLSIFQTVYEDFENEIENSSMLLDAEYAPNELILEMADWMAIEDKLLWSSEKLRKVLKNANKLIKARGTLEALSLILEIFLGVKPYFVETYHAMHYYGTSKNLKRLYSNDRFSLWILVFKSLSDRAEIVLRHLIEKNKPAFVNAHLMILKPNVIMDSNVYLGINSVVSEYPKAALNGQFMLGYGAIGYA